jgi:hypothetical protein
MKEISKADFIEKFKDQLTGDENSGYIFKKVFISSDKLASATNQLAPNIEILEDLLNSDDDAFAKINNAIIAFIINDGITYQGSYEENLGSGIYNWIIDFGNILIDNNKKGVFYSGLKFYKDGN